MRTLFAAVMMIGMASVCGWGQPAPSFDPAQVGGAAIVSKAACINTTASFRDGFGHDVMKVWIVDWIESKSQSIDKSVDKYYTGVVADELVKIMPYCASSMMETVYGWKPDLDAKSLADRPIQSAPLKCDKYQHVEHSTFCDLPERCREGYFDPKHDRCVDDLHTVTEREFQAIMERIKKLEEKEKAIK